MSEMEQPDETIFAPPRKQLGDPYTIDTILTMTQMPGGEWHITSITDSDPVYCSLIEAQQALGKELTRLALMGKTVRVISYNYPGFDNE